MNIYTSSITAVVMALVIEPAFAAGLPIDIVPYGSSKLATVYCRPKITCVVELIPDERVMEVKIGYTKDWNISVGYYADKRPVVSVVPARVDVESNAIILTNKRMYYVSLHSVNVLVKGVRFSLEKDGNVAETPSGKVDEKTPDPLLAKVDEKTPDAKTDTDTDPGIVNKDDKVEKKNTRTIPVAKKMKITKPQPQPQEIVLDKIDPKTINLNYQITGDATWKPSRVLDDGKETYIHMPTTVAPPILTTKARNGTDTVIPYSRVGSYLRISSVIKTAQMKVAGKIVSIVNGNLVEH